MNEIITYTFVCDSDSDNIDIIHLTGIFAYDVIVIKVRKQRTTNLMKAFNTPLHTQLMLIK